MKLNTAIGGMLTLGTQVIAQNAVEDTYGFLKPIPTGTKHSFGVRAGIGILAGTVSTSIAAVVAKDLASIINTMNETELDAPSEVN